MVCIEPLEILLKLYIAEKPSLGRAIAAVLPNPHKSQQGYIAHGNDVTINHHKFDTIFLLYNSINKVILSRYKLDAVTKLKTLKKSFTIIDKYIQKKSLFLTLFDNHNPLLDQA